MYNIFKFKSIKSKILAVLLVFFAISQLIISSISYINIESLGRYSKAEIARLGENLANKSEYGLKSQSEDFLEKLAESSAESSNEILENIHRQVCTLELALSSIYEDSGNFKGSVPLLPDMSEIKPHLDRNLAYEKAYVIDPQNSLESSVLAYDLGEYPEKFAKNIYRTSIKDWLMLPEEEREKIQNTKNVVSNRILPANLKAELQTISNSAYTVIPMYKQNPTISSTYIATESGIFYKYSPDSSPVRFDPRKRDWYTDAVNAKTYEPNKTIWQIPYPDHDSDTLCITCSKAFCDSNGEILGVVACDMYLSEISKYIVNSKNDSGSYTFIIGENGEIVMHPDYEGHNDTNFDPFPLEHDIDTSYRDALNNMKDGKSGIQKVKIDTKEYYIAYSPMPQTNWSFGIATEVNEIIKPALEAGHIATETATLTENVISSKTHYLLICLLLIFAVCLFFSFAFSVILSEKITKPLKKLKEGAKKIGEGDLECVLEVEDEDEVGELALTFNKMAKDLKSYIKKLSETISDKEKEKNELSIAKRIQLSMLPCIFPAFPDRKDFDIYAITDPAKEVGGDFYDFFFVDDTHLAIVIADVSGKGIPSALFMVISKILIKNQLQAGKSPKDTLRIVNNQLYENNDADMFVTAFIGVFDLTTGEMTFSNAGHNPPFLYRSGRNSFESIKMDHGFVLAGVKDKEYKNYKINLSENDVLFMYTDGVTEATNAQEIFSENRLKITLNDKEIKNLGIKEMIHAVKNELSAFYNGAPKFDDITIMAFKVMKKFPH